MIIKDAILPSIIRWLKDTSWTIFTITFIVILTIKIADLNITNSYIYTDIFEICVTTLIISNIISLILYKLDRYNWLLIYVYKHYYTKNILYALPIPFWYNKNSNEFKERYKEYKNIHQIFKDIPGNNDITSVMVVSVIVSLIYASIIYYILNNYIITITFVITYLIDVYLYARNIEDLYRMLYEYGEERIN